MRLPRYGPPNVPPISVIFRNKSVTNPDDGPDSSRCVCGSVVTFPTIPDPGAPLSPLTPQILGGQIFRRLISRALASSFLHRWPPFRYRTKLRAECVNSRTAKFFQGHNVWGLGPPKSSFCRFLAVCGL